jgi:hypothetical protein
MASSEAVQYSQMMTSRGVILKTCLSTPGAVLERFIFLHRRQHPMGIGILLVAALQLAKALAADPATCVSGWQWVTLFRFDNGG